MTESRTLDRVVLSPTIAATLALAACVTPLAGQSWFERQHKTHLPPALVDFAPLAVIDHDQDGRDEVYGLSNGVAGFLAFEANEQFVLRQIPAQVNAPGFNTFVGDLNGDTWPDLVSNGVWLNDGQGGLLDLTATHWLAPSTVHPYALGDFDSDGDLDVFLGSPVLGTFFLENDGSGRLIPFTQAVGPNSVMHWGDLDRDGRVDMIDGMGRLWFQTGAFVFVDRTATHSPGRPAYSEGMHLVDLTGDGAPELLSTSYANHRCYLNDGSGRFVEATQTLWADAPYGPIGSFCHADFDGDGDLDLKVGIYVPGSDLAGEDSPGRDLLYLNDGTGVLAHSSDGRLEPDACQTHGSWVADFDGDGDPDLVSRHVDYVAHCNVGLHRNDGTARFVDLGNPWEMHLGGIEGRVSFGDLDRDGLPEAIVARDTEWNARSPSRAGHFDGDRLLTGPLGGPQSFPFGERLADLDGDGDLDVVTIAFEPCWHENTTVPGGPLQFDQNAHLLPQLGSRPTSADAIDMDGDGDLDLILQGGTFLLLENDGRGNFTDRTSAVSFGNDWIAEPTRVNGDTAIDLVVTHRYIGGQLHPRVLIHDGQWGFIDETVARTPSQLLRQNALAVDIDRDRDDDLLLTDPAQGDQSVLWLNDNGVFSDATVARLPTFPRLPVLFAFDANVDGFVDLAIRDPAGHGFGHRLLWNDGSGTFVLGDTDARFFGEPAGDLDLDGDIDLVVFERYRFGFEWNRARHISCTRVPRVGGSFDLRVEYRSAGQAIGGAAIPVLGLPMTTPIDVGIGHVFLDPGQVFGLPARLLSTASGHFDVSTPIPADAGLLGVELGAQAFFAFSSGAAPFLTGTVHEAIQN